jgi:signal transduction histidine kinase
MSEPQQGPPDARVDDATRTLASLASETDAVRAELKTLREMLAGVEQDFRSSPGTLLREANEQLVLAAMRSEELAERARSLVPPPLQPGAAAALRMLATLRDTNEQLLLSALRSQELEHLAEEAHRRQIAFLATVAHELRNPLLPLRLAAQLLTRAQTNPSLLTSLQTTITGQVSHMARLIGDLLDGARISTGKFRLERARVDLTPILRLAVETAAPLLSNGKCQFDASYPAQPLPVHGDPVRLVQIFTKLLENACKYTPKGGHIRLEAAAADEWAVVTVKDDGIGIDPLALPHIFKLFTQDAHAVAVDGAGLGIGLAVVHELVEAHGGSVRVISAGKGQGSEFIVSLPLVKAAA